jgi:hypothetical protein
MLSSYNWNIAIGLRGVRLETTNDHHLRLSKDAARGIALAARKNKLLWDWPYRNPSERRDGQHVYIAESATVFPEAAEKVNIVR